MAKRITAIARYRPRLKLNDAVDTEMLTNYIARGTALNRGEIRNVLSELNEAIITFASQGTPVYINGIGYFAPSIRLDGSLNVSLRMDPSIRRQLNRPGAFRGEVLNRASIGRTKEELVALWNEEHPDDPVEEA